MMNKVSSGIRDLNSLIDSLYIGDNVVWEVDVETSMYLKEEVPSLWKNEGGDRAELLLLCS